ncbi:hypothetical protein [Pseudomonas aeruginosa]|uniref:hypothetical protein n=1 Tax=Pseudomonas aeruginosa TaxID=287 RepID=UPI000BB954F0|nr:hypothetical protein [Pseudomonas aeruginosa]AXR09980.1 hypothetical protein DZ899_07245 [Pseudomonas aeruginosa]EIU2598518.1 hypothetical protein [Pseudomonas aeruginosa]EIU2879818.1 hypothetical protein [Pseudomonas aeruginosa]ELC7283635.1 hypothetical protein [Pseudomonas aeruginosa]ELK4865859.1 hypothetical protein [Pseudomonas aeruginosa]
MAEYTLTIKDEDGGISILLAGKGQANTAAALAANALLGLAPRLVQDAVRAAAQHSNCPCPNCAARRAAQDDQNQTDSKPTLH